MFNSLTLHSLKEALLAKSETIAVAESVTAGFLQAALSSAERAMLFFQGGITVYNIGQKYRHLLVDPIHASACNCVSERVAQEMAHQVCQLFSSDWGLAITGYASPVPESQNELFAYYAISYRGDVLKAGKIMAQLDDPIQVRLFYTNLLLEVTVKEILSKSE